MEIRTIIEEREKNLSPYAVKSYQTEGREFPLKPDSLRSEFMRDRDRILHSKSFRRLKHKTQVFLSPEGDHYRTRLTHTLEVQQIARTIARSLRLNEDLVEAISLGHDLGHTPFGHTGEGVLNRLSGHFEHNEQSLRVVEVRENDGKGLNLTFEVKDGILNHKKSGKPKTLEGKIVSYADRIAYINHDIEDAERAGILKEKDLPKEIIKILGNDKSKRITTLVKDLVLNSMDKPFVALSQEKEEAMEELRNFMFKNVYHDNDAKSEEVKANRLIELLYKHFLDCPQNLPSLYLKVREKDGDVKAVLDYISSMSDNFAIKVFRENFIPEGWSL